MRTVVALILVVGSLATVAAATPTGVGVDEHVGARVPADLTFIDGDGARVPLSSLIDARTPTLLVLAYFRCPLLCDQIVGGLAESLPAARIASGGDYRALIVSFDPRDTPRDATDKAHTLLASANAFERARWHFVTDDRGSAARLADAVGFRYRFDRGSDQYAHPAVVIVLGPGGRVSQYLYGVSFPPAVLTSALDDASAGRGHASLERVLLTCFQYVPSLRRHAAAVAWILRGGTSVAFAALALSLVAVVRRQQRRVRAAGGRRA